MTVDVFAFIAILFASSANKDRARRPNTVEVDGLAMSEAIGGIILDQLMHPFGGLAERRCRSSSLTTSSGRRRTISRPLSVRAREHHARGRQDFWASDV
jgi:hypothetical protein